MIDALRDALGAERASVFQYDAARHELFATRAHGLPTDLRLPADIGIIGEAARARRIINIPDAYADERFNPEVDKATGFRTRCLLTIPLVDPEGELIGVAQVLNKRGDDGGVFGDEDERAARYVADQAAVALKRASLLESERLKEKLEADLQIARKIQESSLRDTLPELEGYDLAARTRPADETGGDAFDLLRLEGDGPGRVAVFMGDATGHGVGPALSVVQVLAMLRMACRIDAPLDRVAYQINEQLCEDLPPGRFVTAFLGVLDAGANTLSWVSAGQAPLLFLRAGSGDDVSLGSNGMPFGIDTDFTPDPVEPFAFGPGDVFALLSDGYYEAMGPGDDMFGQARIIETIRAAIDRPASEILAALDAALGAFTGDRPADDDQTAVIIKRRA